MAQPSKSVINRARKRVDNLKNKFEVSIKRTFHKWQVKVFVEFKSQIQKGASILIVPPELKADLRSLLINHYHEVSEGFVPGLNLDQLKQATTGDPVGTEDEDEDNIHIDWMLPGVFANIIKGISAQIDLNLPIHERSIYILLNKLAPNRYQSLELMAVIPL